MSASCLTMANIDNTERDIVNTMISDAVEKGVSDVKIDHISSGLRISFKIEGELTPYLHIPSTLAPYVLTELQRKVGLLVGNIQKNEDVRYQAVKGNYTFRVSQLHKHDDSIVISMRLLKQDVIYNLDRLGLDSDFISQLRDAMGRRGGLIIIAGPTDSGKSTTIAAALHDLGKRQASLNILSAEDPIEYQIDWVTQIEVNADKPFSALMRQFLRLNPDVIYLGEVRDSESAQLCIEAARTGHQVITTIHADSIASIKNRFIDDFGVSIRDFDQYHALSAVQHLIKAKGETRRRPRVEFTSGGRP